MSPHHTISEQALTGGGQIPRPGVISLAHHAVLFLDEFGEFKRKTLDVLRQPMEEKEVHIARTYGNYTYPAAFMMTAAMNIATTKLIQCRVEEMPENKAFQGIGKVGYWILVSVAVKWNQSYLALCTSF